ncbi:MAG: DUF4279 domain-containing protein [Chloroflexi bacterium]|nr:MAG: DUF4279 domain-containing protein [Chloroflexota bacterium]
MLDAKLVVYRDELEPSEISARLGLEPTHAFRRGDPIVTKRRRYSDHPIGGWILSSRDLVSSDDLEAHLVWILDRVEPASYAIRSLVSDRYDIALICVVSGHETGGGPTFQPVTLARIAKLEIPLDFDLYA